MAKASISISTITKFLRLILTSKNFVFDGVNCLQKKGCAMGTKCTPSYASLFMDGLKMLILRCSKFYLRYIGDILLIWIEVKEEFEFFLQKINICHPAIESEHQLSKTEISFPDTTLFKVSNQLHSKLFTNPSDKKSYLNSKTEHIRSMRNSTAYRQVLGLKKICCSKSGL